MRKFWKYKVVQEENFGEAVRWYRESEGQEVI